MNHVVFNDINREISLFEGSEEEVLTFLKRVRSVTVMKLEKGGVRENVAADPESVYVQPGNSDFLLRGDIYLDEEIRGLARDKRPKVTPEMVAYLKKLGVESGWPTWWIEQISSLVDPENN